MDKINKEKIENLAKTMRFSLKDEEVDRMLDDFKQFIEQVSILKEIPNLEAEKEMIFPFDCESDVLYEDKKGECLTKDKVLALSKETKDGQVRIPRVVQ